MIHSFKTPLGRELSPEDRLLQMKLYRFSNLEEFVAGVITDKNFRTQMSKHTYKGQTILDNIAKILEQMFNTIAQFSGRDMTITEAGVSAVYDILTDIRESEKSKTVQPQSDPDAKKIIDEAEGKKQETSKEDNTSEDSETSIGTFNIFAEEAQEDRKFLSEKFLSELNTQPFTKAISLVLRKVTKKC